MINLITISNNLIKSVIKKLKRYDEKHAIHIFIPYKIIIPLVLILMALTGKIGATLALFLAAFLVIVFMISDDYI